MWPFSDKNFNFVGTHNKKYAITYSCSIVLGLQYSLTFVFYNAVFIIYSRIYSLYHNIYSSIMNKYHMKIEKPQCLKD